MGAIIILGSGSVRAAAPAISISAPSVSHTAGGPVTYTITYSGADAVTLAEGDVTLNATGTPAATVGVSGSGNATRTVTLSGVTGDGTLGIGIAAGTAEDGFGNASAAAGPSATFVADNTAPTISIGAPSVSSVLSSGGATVTYAITYADNVGVDSVSLVDGNITVNTTGTATGTATVSGSGTGTRTITVSAITGVGTIGISLAAGTAVDASGNAAPAAGPGATFQVVTPEIDVHDGANPTDPSIAHLGSSAGFGTTVYGIPITRTFNIENDGTSPLNVSLTTLPAGFSLVGVFPGAIDVGASATFTVRLDATAVGSQGGIVVIDTDDLDEDPFIFQIGGVVNKATPTVSIVSDNDDPNNVNHTVTVVFTVTPPGQGTPSGTVTVRDDTGVTETVNVSAGSAVLDCMPVGSRIITANYNGDAHFNSAADTESHTVIGPDIVVSGNSVAIPDGDKTPGLGDRTGYGNSGEYPYVVTRTYTIRNDGTDTLNLTGPNPVTLAGADPGPYTITQPTTLILAVGGSTTFSITFAPEIAGPMDAVVHIASDDKSKTDFDFAITGMIIPSAIDLTYNPGIGPNRKVQDVKVQAAGKAVIVGAFITYNNISRKYVARVGVDGSLDASFDPGTGASHQINAVDIHTGGKILIGGRFTSYDGMTVGRVARLHIDGSLDTGFQTTSGGADGEVWALAVQPDQKILIGGAFQYVNGVGRVRIARLNSDGSVDTSFNAGVGPDLTVRHIELQADGKILVGGHFRKWNGVNTTRLIRLNSDGSVDGSFSSPLPDNGYVTEIIKDEGDGDIYVSGGTRRLLRLNNDGSIQWDVGLGFDSDPNAILLTQDGRIITGGYFTKFNGAARTRLARLNSNGTLNGVFDPQPGANARILRFARQPDGRIIAVGEFTTYRGEVRNFITRMINDIRIGPFFSLQPETQTVEEGTVFTLASMAEGQIPVTYQWFKDSGGGSFVALADGGNIAGTATKNLVFNTITASDAGTYHVVATNPNGSTTSDTVTITVTPNQAPTINPPVNLSLIEDDPQQTLNLTGISNGAAHENGQTLVITATSSDTGIIPDPTVTYTSGEATGTLTFTPVADAHGTATITLTLVDNGQTANGGVTTTVETFDVVVASVNDTPTLVLNPTTFTRNEDSGAFTQAGFATFSPGPANEAAQTLNIVCNNNNPGIFLVPPAIDVNGTLTFTPLVEAFGTAVITAYARDNGGGADTSPTRIFTIVINPVNDQPSFILDVTTLNFVEDSGFNQVTIITTTVRGPANETTQKVDRYEIVGNTNPGLLTGLEVTSNGILKASTVVTIQLVDNGGTANGGVNTSTPQSFTVTVGPPNFPPDFDLAANLYTHLEDSGSYAVANFVGNVGPGDVSEAGQTDTFTITAADPTLFAVGPTLTPNGADYELSYTLADDAVGSTVVTVTGTDDGPGNAAQNKTFTVTVTEVNDEPGFTVGADVTVNEDSGAQTLAGFATGISAGPPGESGQALTFHVSNDKSGLFDVQPDIDESTGDLTFTPSANANGSATVSVYLTDDGGTGAGGDDTSDTRTFTITVNEVNDAPSFVAGGDVSIFRGAGAHDAAWATLISPGALDEAGQTLVFAITANDNPGLFSVGPAIDGTTGRLSFTPSTSANGTAHLTVELRDDGGTANGGEDTSAQVSFAITISGSQVFVDGTPSLVGDTVAVPINLNGTGIENSVSFTLDYDATRLVFGSATVPSGSIVVNSVADGKVGVLIVLGAGSTFSPGNNNIANLTFTLASTATAGTAATAAIGFSSSPVLQQVTDAGAGIIAGTSYVGADVLLTEGTSEGDVAPRPLGNGSLSVADATAIGMFAAGLATANNGREFQAADSAPVAGGGDGVISIADWVQNLRDIAGLDGAPRALSGPTQPAVAPAGLSSRRASHTDRLVTVETDGLVAGGTGTVRLVLEAGGTEAGFSCSLRFDPNTLIYLKSATATGGMLIVNSQQAASGMLGLVLALQPGQAVSAGHQALVELTFSVTANAAPTASISFNSSPVLEEVTDANARRLPAAFVGGSFPVQLPTGFETKGVEIVDGQPRFTFGRKDGSAVEPDQLNDLEVYATSNIGGAWIRLNNALRLVNGRVHIIDPGAGEGLRFYQVRRAASADGAGSATTTR